jgi:hypothetical protein
MVGTTPTEPGTTTSSRLYPRPDEALDRAAGSRAGQARTDETSVAEAAEAPGVAVAPEVGGGGEAGAGGEGHIDSAAQLTLTRAEGRQALRAARRRRRLISIGCAVLIALCTLATVLIVDLARTRTSGPPAVTRSAPIASWADTVVPAGAAHLRLPRNRSPLILDALASPGGHR